MILERCRGAIDDKCCIENNYVFWFFHTVSDGSMFPHFQVSLSSVLSAAIPTSYNVIGARTNDDLEKCDVMGPEG